MNLASILKRDAVIPALNVNSKKQALQALAERAAQITDLPERDILAALMERERLGCTALGKGFAVPHARFKDLKDIYGLFARLEHPVEFDAEDGVPVDIIFLLLAPASSQAAHLKALNAIARKLRDTHVTEKLRASVTQEVLYAVLTEEPGEE